MRANLRVTILAVSIAILLSTTAASQTASSPDPHQTTVSGTTLSSSRNTLTVKTANNLYQVFVFDSHTVKPGAISEGAHVTVISEPTSEPGLRLALRVILTDPQDPQRTAQSTTPAVSAESPQPGQAARSADPPDSVHQAPPPAWTGKLERDIERHAGNFGVGFRAGFGMDPEVLIVGAHARMGPIFNRNISFRPSAEFGFGEVTKMFALNLDTTYRLPLTPRWSSWSMYLGGGPGLGFSQQNFERSGEGGIDWGNLEFTPSLNIITGLEFRTGFLVEVRAAVYARPNPTFRLMFGYSF
jgi:hypothetical protein